MISMTRVPRPTDSVRIPYTLCLVFSEQDVLLLERRKPPFQGYLNGLGGKIKPHESALTSMKRELLEEDIALTPRQVDHVRYVGPTIWFIDEEAGWLGMHLFSLRVVSASARRKQSVFGDEGVMTWIPLQDLEWPMKVHAVPNIPTLIGISKRRQRHPGAVCLIPCKNGGYDASVFALNSDVPWPLHQDERKLWRLKEMISFESSPHRVEVTCSSTR